MLFEFDNLWLRLLLAVYSPVIQKQMAAPGSEISNQFLKEIINLKNNFSIPIDF